MIIGMVIGVPLQLVKGFCRGDDQGIDYDQRRNKIQVQVGIGVSLVGVIAAWLVANDQLAQHNGPAWGSLVAVPFGAVAGFAAGVFLTGAYLAILDATATVRDWMVGQRRK